MADINNPKELETLRAAANSKHGRLLIDFLKQQLDDVSFETIDTSRSDEAVGQDFKVVSKARKFINKLLNLLTPEKGD